MADRTPSRKTQQCQTQTQRKCRRKTQHQHQHQPYNPPLPPLTSLSLSQAQAQTQTQSHSEYQSYPVSTLAPVPTTHFMATVMPQTLPLPLPLGSASTPATYQASTTDIDINIDILMTQGDSTCKCDYPVSTTGSASDYLLDHHHHPSHLSHSSHSHSDLSLSAEKLPSPAPRSVIGSGTGTLSFLTIGSPSVVTDEGTGSYIMVGLASATGTGSGIARKRTYSEQSCKSSDGGSGSGALYSTPDDGEWGVEVLGAGAGAGAGVGRASGVQGGREFAVVEGDVDRDVMDEDGEGDADGDLSSMPHDPKLLLYCLGTNEPRTVENPYQYQQVQSSGYQDLGLYPDSQNYSYQTANHQIFVQTSGPAKVSSDGPWSPVAPQVPVYDSGYVAFLPSPGPAGEQDSEPSRSRASSATHSPQPQHDKSSSSTSPSKSSSSRSEKTSSGKGKEKEEAPAWEHTVVAKGGLQFVSENVKEELDMRSGIRKGKLDPETAEKARRIRRMKACWNCWIQKVPCSEERVCDRCTKLLSPVADQLCCRTGFKDYESTFFPDYLHAHFKKRKIEDLISEHTSGFSNTVLVVDVSTGGLFKPMTLSANIFRPKTRELLRHASLVSQPGQDSQLVERYSAPVGILGLSQSEMRNLCKEHIDEMIANPAYAAQATVGDDTQLPYEILEIVRTYCAKKDIPLVQNALRLHAIHYFMSTLITFSPTSASTISHSLRNYSALLEPYLSSRLLNRQIKYVMHKLHREITISVLDTLERSLRTRTKDSWGPSFCAILILCLCIEDLQIAADTMVVCDMLKRGKESVYTREQSYQVCLKLDEFPFAQCKRLFHDIYKSHKEGSGGGVREGGFNPLRAVLEGGSTGLDECADLMVREVYGVMQNSYDEMIELSKRVATIEFGFTVKPKDIKTNNTGRLASDFLRSFFPES